MITTTTREEIQKYFDLIPPSIRRHAYMCSGAAVDLSKAGDVDFLILGPYLPSDIQELLVQHLSDRARGETLEVSTEAKYQQDEERVMLGTIKSADSDMLDADVLWAKDATIFDALDRFDTSVHMVALGSDFSWYAGPRYTTPNEPIQVHRYEHPKTTLTRYRRLCERYGQAVDPVIVTRLKRHFYDKEEETF